jgi:superfamily II DNA/RNA helicase
MTIFNHVVDNIGGNTADAVLRYYIKSNSLCSVASAYFTVSGFELVASQLERCKDFRLFLGAEPGADPLRMAILDIWKNIDIRDSPKQAERAVKFFSQDNVQIRLHAGTFFHGKTYILNHPEPAFEKQESAPSKEKPTEEIGERQRPTQLTYKGKTVTKSDDAAALVGSSNFTYGGLRQNAELNLLDASGESIVELLTWFQERWETSNDIKAEFIKLLQGYYRPFDPFWIYAKALYELYKEDLEGPEGGKPGSTIELADFQTAGYKSAMRILNRYNAVLIADAPGLGKTWIGGKLLEEYAYYKREPALIICPAEVEPIWRRFASTHKIPIGALLHTEILGRGTKEGCPQCPPQQYKDYSFILVDESHHFRNPDAGRYLWMQQLLALPKPEVKVEGKKVQLDRKLIFVTATPVNNSVWDLYWQLRLLVGKELDNIALRQGIKDLTKYFENAETGDGNLYDLIEALAVRRSRTFIKEYYPKATIEGRPINFPDRELEKITYHMHPSLEGLYAKAATSIERCKLVPYRIENYRKAMKDEAKVFRGELLSTLFRILVLKRLESSLRAFQCTLQNIANLFQATLANLEEGRVMSVENFREYLKTIELSQEDDNTLDLRQDQFLEKAEDFDIDSMKNDLRIDIQLLNEILTLLPDDPTKLIELDQKFLEIKKELKGTKDKILIFTSFKDTADYIYKNLQSSDQTIGLVTGEQAKIWTGTKEIGTNRAKIINLFSPKSNGYTIPSAETNIQILISTDVLSEAINLQDAGKVMNYDFPWNPMKLVQRAGRIDRIGSTHPKVTILNLFYEKGLEIILGLMQKLLTKIAQVHRSVGLEWSLLGEEPLPVDFATTIERVRTGDKRVLIDIEKKMEGLIGLDPQEQLLAILQTLSKDEIERIPDGAGSLTKLQPGQKNRKTGFFVAYRKHQPSGAIDRIWRFFQDDQLAPITNKTQIVEQIQFPKQYKAEPRFEEPSMERLKQSRLTIEEELAALEALQRTKRITGPMRKAFDLARRLGRADLDKFLQTKWDAGAVQRKIRTINFNREDEAIKELEKLYQTFGEKETEVSESKAEPQKNTEPPTETAAKQEMQQLPKERDPTLEIVCWMHIIQ